MAISVNWATKIITVPKADTTLLTLVPFEVRELDLNVFRLALKDLEDDEDGQPWPDTHRHNTSVTLGGVTLARTVEIINGYTVTFEAGSYAVNLVGANSNIADVANLNQVSIRASNSAGLTQTFSSALEGDLSFEDAFRIMLAALTGKRTGLGTGVETYHGVDGTTERVVFTQDDEFGNGEAVLDGS
jgi:hypothetical protein